MSDLIERVDAARRFPTNTCPASRHAAQIGEALVRRWRYPMLTEEPAHCGESILSAVASLWEARTEIERLTAALQYEQHRAGRQGTHGDGCADWGPAHYECAIRERDELRERLVRAEASVEEMCADSWQLRKTISRVEAERDELRRQLDPMGEYTSADELIATLHAEKAEDDAMKRDAQRYRWLRGREDGRYMTVYAFRTDIDEVCLGDELDAAIDAQIEKEERP